MVNQTVTAVQRNQVCTVSTMPQKPGGRFLRRCLFFVCMVFAFAVVGQPVTILADEQDAIRIQLGFQGQCKLGCWLPVYNLDTRPD